MQKARAKISSSKGHKDSQVLNLEDPRSWQWKSTCDTKKVYGRIVQSGIQTKSDDRNKF